MNRHASAVWNGDLPSGDGTMSVQSGAFEALPFSFKTRFEDAAGTNPEELIGAAHAGCFSMAFSHALASAGLTPQTVSTKATISIEAVDGGFAITRSHLECEATVPGADEDKVSEIAAEAKDGCPVSKVLNAEIALDLIVNT